MYCRHKSSLGFSYHPTVGLLSWLTVLFTAQKLCNLMQLHLLTGVVFPEQPESCPGIFTKPICWQALFALPSRSFRVLGLTLRSLIHWNWLCARWQFPNSIGSRCCLLLSACFCHLCQNSSRLHELITEPSMAFHCPLSLFCASTMLFVVLWFCSITWNWARRWYLLLYLYCSGLFLFCFAHYLGSFVLPYKL